MLEGKDREITEMMVKEFKKRRDFVYGALKEIGLDAHKPEGAFYVFPQIPMNCVEFSEKLVDAGVVVTPGTPFGDGNENYVRISYATSMENLKKAMERIAKFVAEIA
jgi:aspartate/methionine/tyrosine aminotransferase